MLSLAAEPLITMEINTMQDNAAYLFSACAKKVNAMHTYRIARERDREGVPARSKSPKRFKTGMRYQDRNAGASSHKCRPSPPPRKLYGGPFGV
jgi:hypothetical protein